MTWRLFGCEKFRWLSSESADRQLNPKEIKFLEKHRAVCIECVRAEDQSASALNMLRSITLEAEASPAFEDRVLRRLKVSRARESFRYWSPSFVGAGIACVAIFSALQIVATGSTKPTINAPNATGYIGKPRSEALPVLLLGKPARKIDGGSLREIGVRQ